MHYIVRPMRLEDIPQVADIERQSFTLPWPSHAYKKEITENRLARYIVVQLAEDRQPTPGELPPKPAGGFWDSLRRITISLTEGRQEEAPASWPPIAGYAGLWLMADEAHITTIAVRPDLRGRGLGELLLCALADVARNIPARWLTLEVRVSNTVAQNLYRKYGFMEHGLRRYYYSDNSEDAIIMWSEALDSPEFRQRLATLREALWRRLGAVEVQPLMSRA